MTRSGLDLVVAINGTSDKVTVRSFYFNNDPTNTNNPIQSIAFSDSTSWSLEQIQFIVNNSGANHAPVYATPVSDRSFGEGAAISFALPAGTFVDTDPGEHVSYIATLPNGGPLPSWLTFDAATQAFSGTAPVGSLGATSVRVTATDTLGLTAFGTFNVTVLAENKLLIGTAGADTLTGWSGNDSLTGAAGDDALIAGAGNDLLDGGLGNDSLDGGLGNDIYLFGRGDGQDVVADGVDTALGKSNVIRFKPGVSASEVSVARAGSDLIVSINGTTDKLTVKSFYLGGDPLNPANPVQRIEFADATAWDIAAIQFRVDNPGANHAPTVASALADQSVNEGAALNFSVPIGAFTDPDAGNVLTYSATALDGSALPGWLSFNAATRIFIGTTSAPGTTSIKVSAKDGGNLSVSDVFDIVVAQAAPLTRVGTANGEYLGGMSNNDTLSGLGGYDTLYGYAGDDLLDGGTENDALHGGSGNDVYIVDSTFDSVWEDANEGTDRVESSASFALWGYVENLTLTGASAINATGNDLANTLIGNSAANWLNGAGGADTMIGGGGNDTYVVDDAGDVVTELAGGGSDEVQASVSVVLSNEVERLVLTGTSDIGGTGNASNNQINGNSGANRIDGGAGADSMYGGAGYDTYVVDNAGDVISEVYGGGLNAVESSVSWTLGFYDFDRLTLTGSANISGTGNEWANILVGNAGNNVLNGGTGWDTMTGGLGDDTYFVDEYGDTDRKSVV